MDILLYNNTIDFTVACGFEYGEYYVDFFKKNKIKYLELSSKKNVLKYMISIYKLVKRGNYNKVYIHGNSSMMILEALPNKLCGINVITHCHNTSSGKKTFIYKVLKPFFNLCVDCKIGCSNKAAKWAYNNKNVTVVLNGVDVDRFKYNPQKRREVRKLLGVEGKKLVGHIGTFNRQKNHLKLIGVFEELLKLYPDSSLLLIGDGELKRSVIQCIKDKEISDKVIFLDYISNPEDYLQAMDIVIMPSLFEGFCLVALEAQVSGLPVLVSDALPEEAVLTDNSKVLSLNASNQLWAESALKLMKNKREDNSRCFKVKGLEYDSMLEKISKILLKD